MTLPRSLAAFAMLLAAMLLAVTPRGFMPEAGHSGFQLVLCSASGSGDAGNAGSLGLAPTGKARPDCPFALLASPAPPPLFALMHPVQTQTAVRFIPLPPALVLLLAVRLHPPAQAPPASS